MTMTTDAMIMLLFVAVTGCAATLYLYASDKAAGGLDYDNALHRKRFYILFFGLLVASFLMAFLPSDIWPYPLIYLAIGLFSNMSCGIVGGSALLLITTLCSGTEDPTIVIIYLLCGMIALTLFRHMDEAFQVPRPMVVTLTFLYVLLVMNHTLIGGEELTARVLLLPLINVFACLVLMSVLLNFFGRHVVRQTNDMYMEINDPEYELMVNLKEQNKEGYFLAIHSAYLAERIATDLQMDVRATKACAYYHAVCKELGGADGPAAFARSKRFPEDAIKLIDEYENPPATGYVSKEAAVVNICETLVRMIKSIFVKDKTAKVDYDAMIDKIFEHHWQKGDLNLNGISFGEMTRIRQLLKKEQLYYDFLR